MYYTWLCFHSLVKRYCHKTPILFFQKCWQHWCNMFLHHTVMNSSTVIWNGCDSLQWLPPTPSLSVYYANLAWQCISQVWASLGCQDGFCDWDNEESSSHDKRPKRLITAISAQRDSIITHNYNPHEGMIYFAASQEQDITFICTM